MMNYSIIGDLIRKQGMTKKHFYQKIDMSKTGFNLAVKNDTLKVRDLEKISQVLKEPVLTFFEGTDKPIFFSHGDNSPVSIGSSVSQNIQSGSGSHSLTKDATTSQEMELLQAKNEGLEKEIEGLKAQLALKDEIIGMLKG